MITVDIWQLVSLLLGFFGCVAGFGKLLLAQIDKRLDTRFEAQERARIEGSQGLRNDARRAACDGARAYRAASIRWSLTCGESLSAMEGRLSRVESEVKHGVGQRELSDIYDRINEVAEGLSELRGESHAVGDNVRPHPQPDHYQGMQ
ncbi:hypothetical protein ABCS64_12560 [Rhodocyclaceae bacterium Wk13]|uniref:Uncharacterized protein n=2 Tax=Dentiradicibacter hellwigii TaxID=3149053 RepID=A0ABV4UHM3_9RHOO